MKLKAQTIHHHSLKGRHDKKNDSIYNDFLGERNASYSFFVKAAFWWANKGYIEMVLTHLIVISIFSTIGLAIAPVITIPFAIIGAGVSFFCFSMLDDLAKDVKNKKVENDINVLEKYLAETIFEIKKENKPFIDSTLTEVQDSTDMLKLQLKIIEEPQAAAINSLSKINETLEQSDNVLPKSKGNSVSYEEAQKIASDSKSSCGDLIKKMEAALAQLEGEPEAPVISQPIAV
tara:strand:+ start:791 stop:1489 length:699 start_codon:yes stop_codon:yes gene_type:complete